MRFRVLNGCANGGATGAGTDADRRAGACGFLGVTIRAAGALGGVAATAAVNGTAATTGAARDVL